jgi:hypothetical protein
MHGRRVFNVHLLNKPVRHINAPPQYLSNNLALMGFIPASNIARQTYFPMTHPI